MRLLEYMSQWHSWFGESVSDSIPAVHFTHQPQWRSAGMVAFCHLWPYLSMLFSIPCSTHTGCSLNRQALENRYLLIWSSSWNEFHANCPSFEKTSLGTFYVTLFSSYHLLSCKIIFTPSVFNHLLTGLVTFSFFLLYPGSFILNCSWRSFLKNPVPWSSDSKVIKVQHSLSPPHLFME